MKIEVLESGSCPLKKYYAQLITFLVFDDITPNLLYNRILDIINEFELLRDNFLISVTQAANSNILKCEVEIYHRSHLEKIYFSQYVDITNILEVNTNFQRLIKDILNYSLITNDLIDYGKIDA